MIVLWKILTILPNASCPPPLLCPSGQLCQGASSNGVWGQLRGIMPFKVIHGMSKTPIYSIWLLMKQRCLDPNNPAYRYYGGRGIEVCKRWMEFKTFMKIWEIDQKA